MRDKKELAADAMKYAQDHKGYTPYQIKNAVIKRMARWGNYTKEELAYARKSMYGKLDGIWKPKPLSAAEAYYTLLKARAFDESKHRRDEDGKFAEQGGEGSSSRGLKFANKDIASEKTWQKKYAAKWESKFKDGDKMTRALSELVSNMDANANPYVLFNKYFDEKVWLGGALPEINKILGTDFTMKDYKHIKLISEEKMKEVAQIMNERVEGEEFKPEDFSTSEGILRVKKKYEDEIPSGLFTVFYQNNLIKDEIIRGLKKDPYKFMDLLGHEKQFKGLVEVQEEINAIRKKRWDNAKNFYRGINTTELENLAKSNGILGHGRSKDDPRVATSINLAAAKRFGNGIMLEFPKEGNSDKAVDVNYNVFEGLEYNGGYHAVGRLYEEEYYFRAEDKVKVKNLKISIVPDIVNQLGGIVEATKKFGHLGEIKIARRGL